ncbi:hypothetical protein EG329_005102 [Mollisiaceae sp. DMI_Dod_QoI]|nr:hypothetical protein EG329_005102 [Helotiales sp. DMI_Dod_QoI]
MAYHLIGVPVRLVGTGIGLVSESVHHYKDKNHSKSQQIGEGGETAEAADLPRDGLGPKGEGDDVAPPPYQENDEEQWQLDEAQDELDDRNPDPSLAEEEKRKSGGEVQKSGFYNPYRPKMVFEQFIKRHPVPTTPVSAKLSLPVIIPQRRPRHRTRGFIRAYAPVLSEVGIDQAAFIDFLETFNQASLASPLIQVLNLAGVVVTAIGQAYGLVIAAGIQIAVYILDEIQGRKRTNEFLDRVNKEFFRPRGLYALVMTWRPEIASDKQAATSTDVDLTSTITSALPSDNGSTLSQVQRKMKTSDGKTYGDNAFEAFGFAEVAPLVFPTLDELEGKDSEAAKKYKTKGKGGQGFVASYFDKRAMARYSANNPNSMLTTAAGAEALPEFKSRYADPNHPASSGHLFSLLSGGKYNPPRLGKGLGDPNQQHWGIGWVANKIVMARNESKEKKAAAQQQKEQGDQSAATESTQTEATSAEETQAQGEEKKLSQREIYKQRAEAGLYPDGRAGKGTPGAIMRVIQPDVLYLMVVNMPTDEEMAAAAKAVKEAEKEVEVKGEEGVAKA